MTVWSAILGTCLAVASFGTDAPIHDALVKDGWKVGETVVEFAEGALPVDATPEQERAALKEIAGSDRAVAEFVRNSVTAPFVLKSRDLKLGNGDIVRRADVWFVVRASLDQLNPDKVAGDVDGKPFEAGNMRFSARRLDGAELAAAGVGGPAEGRWFTQATARILDRILLSSTTVTEATRSPTAWAIASRNEPKLDESTEFAGWWRSVRREAGKQTEGPVQPYPGGASTVRISQLKTVPGALLVEAHFAFVEPLAWFDGAPVLRSKFSLIAQDRIRGLRRELLAEKSR